MSEHLPLIAEGVSRRYGELTVVSEASLRLEPGKITALLGQSGAGKSTLLRLIAGLEKVDAGNIRLGDRVISSTTTHVPAEARAIGLIFQDFALFPHLNAIENVSFGLRHQTKDDKRRTALDWLDRMGLSHRARAFPHQLSGGEQQRVSIARALAAKPVAILMDEPFSGLDIALKKDVREIALKAVAEAGIPALLVSHDASEAMRDADRIAVMRDGVILQENTPEALYLQPTSLAVARALGPVHAVPYAALPGDWATFLPEADTCYLRPEAVRLDPASSTRLKVTASKRASTLIEVEFTLADGTVLRSVSIGANRPAAGDEVGVSLAPEFAFSLPSGAV